MRQKAPLINDTKFHVFAFQSLYFSIFPIIYHFSSFGKSVFYIF